MTSSRSARGVGRSGTRPRAWHRLVPWALLAVGLVDLVLLAHHDLSPQVAALAAGGAVALKVLVGGDLLAAAGAYRQARSSGRGRWSAANNGLTWVLPRALAWLLLVQIKVSADLLSVPWRRRRRPEQVTMHGDPLLRTLFWLNVALTGVTLGIVELLLVLGQAPWQWHLLDVGGNAYQLWILGGLWATFATRPLCFHQEHLLLRGAVVGQVEIPYADVAEARPLRQEVPSIWSWGRFVAGPGTGALTLAAGTPLNVLLTLREPAQFDPYAVGRPWEPVRKVLLRVDEPRRFLETLARFRDLRAPESHSHTGGPHPAPRAVPLSADGSGLRGWPG